VSVLWVTLHDTKYSTGLPDENFNENPNSALKGHHSDYLKARQKAKLCGIAIPL